MSESGSVAQPSQPSLPTQNEELEAQLQSSRQKTDPAWDYCIYKVVGKKKTYTCMFCNKQINGGGIHRLKEHLAGVVGDVKSCGGVDADTKFRMQENLKETALKKKRAADTFDDEHPFGPNVVELTDDGTSADVPTSSRPKKKATTTQASCKDFFAPSTTPGAQPTIKSVLAGKKAVHECDIAIATFFYENCIPMNATNSSSYQRMIDAITRMSAGYKGPNYHAMRTRLLSDMKKNVQLLVDSCRSQWVEKGCTIMADGWQDKKNRQLINFLVYCPKGISFIRSVDASDIVKDATNLCNLFVELVEFAGPQNVVHLVTDNAANYKAAGRMLHDKYPHIYWSPCAAHCLNLVLGDIGKMELVQGLAKRASLITKFVYNHGFLLAFLRKREGWTEIIRPGPTRFATTFIITYES
jgi:hypothetical protein